jgi:hypothetical protein
VILLEVQKIAIIIVITGLVIMVLIMVLEVYKDTFSPVVVTVVMGALIGVG